MSPSALRETTLIDCFTESVGDQETKLQKKKNTKKNIQEVVVSLSHSLKKHKQANRCKKIRLYTVKPDSQMKSLFFTAARFLSINPTVLLSC